MRDDIARRTVFARAGAALAALWAIPAEARRRHKHKKKKKHPTAPPSPPSPLSPPSPPPADTRDAFVLVTGCGATGGCSCHACEKHAANKLFASREAVIRAHPGCNCQVDTLALPSAQWVALFQPAGLPPTSVVDRRDSRVGPILASAGERTRRSH